MGISGLLPFLKDASTTINKRVDKKINFFKEIFIIKQGIDKGKLHEKLFVNIILI